MVRIMARGWPTYPVVHVYLHCGYVLSDMELLQFYYSQCHRSSRTRFRAAVLSAHWLEKVLAELTVIQTQSQEAYSSR
jgi:hypothetical protein